MDNHWYKTNYMQIRKRHTLHSLCVGLVFFILLYVFTKIFYVSICPIKNIFGVDCFGCGMTRGFISVLELDFKSAFLYNVLSLPIFIAILVYGILAVVDIVFNKCYIYIIEKQLSRKYMYLIYIVVLIVAAILNNAI